MDITLKRDIADVDWQALADVYQETLGPDHIQTLILMNNLASVRPEK